MFEGIRNFFSRLFGGGKKKEERPQVYTPPTMSLNKPTGHPLLDKNPLPLNNRADASSIFPKPQTPTPQSTTEETEARFKPTEPKTEISLNPKPTTSPLATPRVHGRALRDLSRNQRLMQERQNDTFAKTITFDRGEAMRQKAQKARHQDFLNQRRNENLKKQLQSTFEPKFATTDLTPQARRYLREEYDKIVQRIDSGQVRDYGTDEQINRLYQSFTNRLQEVDQANKFAQRVYQSTGNINKAIQARDQQIESKRVANEEQQKYEALKNIGRTLKSPLTLLKGAIGGAGSVAHEGAATFHDIMASASDLLGAEDAKTRFRQSANTARQEASRARQFWGVEKDDNDHNFVYGLGSGGAQLAKDIALTSTGLGFIPVAERAAKTGSQTYLTNRDLGKEKLESLSRAFGNAALQAKLEKVGLDSLTNSIGNKIVRTGLAAASEAAQEGTQEAVDNAFNNRPLEENVLESAAAGLLLGTGAGVAMSKITSPQPHNQTRIESDVRNGIVNANTINSPVELRLETALNSTTINQDTNIKYLLKSDDKGQYVKGENKDGKHKNIKGWNYGEVRYEAPDPSNQQYSAVANVGVDSDGNRQLYTFDKIKKLPAQPESLENRGVSYDSNIAQDGGDVNRLQYSAYDPIRQEIFSYGDQDIAEIKAAYNKYGDNFYDHLTHDEQVIYDNLLNKAPRRADDTYIDPITGEVVIDEVIKRDDGSKYVRIDNNIIEGIDSKPAMQKAVKNHIRNNFQGNSYDIGETGESALVTRRTKNEIAHQQRIMSNIDYKIKARMSGNLNELIENMQDVRVVPNHKPEAKPAVNHYLSGRTEVEVDGELYYPRIDIEVGHKGNMIAYDIADIKKEPRAESDNRSYIRETNSVLDNQGSVSVGNIAQVPDNVNKNAHHEHIGETADEFIRLYSDKNANNPQHKKLGPRQLRILWETLDGTNSDKLRIANEISPGGFYDYTRDDSGHEIRRPRTAEDYRNMAEEKIAYRNSPKYAKYLEEERRKEERYRQQLEDLKIAQQAESKFISRTAREAGISEEAVTKLNNGEKYRERNVFNDRALSQSYNRMSNGGYNAEHMISNRAIDAMRNGRFPAEEAAMRLGLKPETIEEFVPVSEWHHMGEDATPTDFYDMNDLIDAAGDLLQGDADPTDSSVLLLKKMLAHEEGVKYQLNQTEANSQFIEHNLRQILGDEYEVVTNRNQLNGEPLNAQGYTDLKNHIVAILDGKMDTGYHEAGHVVFNALSHVDAQMTDNAITSIIQHYGAENLVETANKAGYDQVVGHTLDFNNEADVNLAAEEQLMNDFAKYAEAKAKGRENYYAKTNNLSAKVKQWFDNVIAYLKDMVGRLDAAHDFMYRAERGDFAQLVDSQVRTERGELFGNSEQLNEQLSSNSLELDSGVAYRMKNRPIKLEESALYQTNPELATKTLAKFNAVKNGWRRQVSISKIDQATVEYYKKNFGIDLGVGGDLILTGRAYNHLVNEGHYSPDGRPTKDNMPLTDADIADLPLVFGRPDRANFETNTDGEIQRGYYGSKLTVEKMLDHNNTLTAELTTDGQNAYITTYVNRQRWISRFDQKSRALLKQDPSPALSDMTDKPSSLRNVQNGRTGAYADNIAQSSDNVKYLIGGEQATGFVNANNLYGGLDGRTKFEFDDSKAEWSFSKDQKPSTGKKALYKLGDIFSHDELYKQYPEAKDITVRFVNRPRSRAGGHVSEVDNLIEVNWGWGRDSAKSSLLHELQHWIQHKEGFSGGNSPESAGIARIAKQQGLTVEEVRNQVSQMIDEVNEIGARINPILQKVSDLTSRGKFNEAHELKATVIDDLNKARQLQKEIKQIKTASLSANERSAIYKRTGGEAESRAVQARQQMTMDERLAKPVYDSYDVPSGEVDNSNTEPYTNPRLPLVVDGNNPGVFNAKSIAKQRAVTPEQEAIETLHSQDNNELKTVLESVIDNQAETKFDEYNAMADQERKAIDRHEQQQHKQATDNFLAKDDSLKKQIMLTDVMEKHRDVMKTASSESLEYYHKLRNELKRIGRNLGHSKNTANAEDVAKFSREYAQKMREIDGFVKKDARNQEIQSLERMVVKKLPDHREKIAQTGNISMFKELDRLVYHELAAPLNNYSDLVSQVERLTGFV